MKYSFFNLKQNKANAIITDAGRVISYKELDKLSEEYTYKINERCLVILECSNRVECIAIYTGLLNKRIPMLLIDDKREHLYDIIDAYKPPYVYMRDASELSDYNKISETGIYSLYERTKKTSYAINDNLALLLSTSGSTGNKKYVRISYDNLLANTKSIIEYLNISDKDRAITAMPMNYTYGLSVITTHIYCGATLLLTEKKIIEKGFWDFFDKCEGTSYSGVPFAYETLYKIGFFKFHHGTLKTLTQAGGKLTGELQEYIGKYALEKGINFYIMYGQTEATARMTYLPHEDILLKNNSVGKPIPGGKIRINTTINKNKAGEDIGEIVYEGANVSMGYATSYMDLVKGDENNGILHTGDIGYVDNDGYLYITGRINRFTKINGIRINLDDVERYMKYDLKKEYLCGEEKNAICIYGEDAEIDYDVIQLIAKYTGLNKRQILYKKSLKNKYHRKGW